jgi:hypothetical protein
MDAKGVDRNKATPEAIFGGSCREVVAGEGAEVRR